MLEYLSSVGEPRTLREVTEDLDVPRASAYALLSTLSQLGWVEYDGNRYRLGIRSLLAGAAYLELDAAVRRTADVMDDLLEEFEETVHLARLDGSSIVYLASRASPHSLSVVLRPGRRLPAWVTALGKALLASRNWTDVEQALPPRLTARTPKTITSRSALRRELVRVREVGFAVDDEESALGLRCFAVPLHFNSHPRDALSISVPIARLDSRREQAIIGALMTAAGRAVVG